MNFHKELWLLLSGFGIMFAISSWLQDSGIIFPVQNSAKGIFSLISGSILYLIIAKKMD